MSSSSSTSTGSTQTTEDAAAGGLGKTEQDEIKQLQEARKAQRITDSQRVRLTELKQKQEKGSNRREPQGETRRTEPETRTSSSKK